MIVWSKDNTDLAWKAGGNDRDSVISSQRVHKRQPIVVLYVKQNKKNSVTHSVDQTKLVVVTTILADNIRVKKMVR